MSSPFRTLGHNPLPTVVEPRLPRWRDMLWILLIFAVPRAALYFWTAAEAPGTLTEQWSRWDSNHYLNIARFGYFTTELPSNEAAFQSRFPPLYPLLIWMADRIPGVTATAAAIWLSPLFLFASSVLLYGLAQAHTGTRRSASMAVALMNVFPTSYFGSAAYSESLFLFLTLLYFWCLVRFQSFSAATAAAVAAVLTRSVGIVLFATHVHAALHFYQRRPDTRVRVVVCVLLPLVAFAAHMAAIQLLLQQSGYFEAQAASIPLQLSVPFAEPLRTVMDMIRRPEDAFSTRAWMTTTWAAFFLIFAAVVLIFGVRRLAPLYRTYAVSYILLVAALTWNISAPRHMWVLFPIYIVLASTHRIVAVGMLVVFSVGLFAFAPIFAAGGWAF